MKKERPMIIPKYLTTNTRAAMRKNIEERDVRWFPWSYCKVHKGRLSSRLHQFKLVYLLSLLFQVSRAMKKFWCEVALIHATRLWLHLEVVLGQLWLAQVLMTSLWSGPFYLIPRLEHPTLVEIKQHHSRAVVGLASQEYHVALELEPMKNFSSNLAHPTLHLRRPKRLGLCWFWTVLGRLFWVGNHPPIYHAKNKYYLHYQVSFLPLYWRVPRLESYS